MVHTRENGKKEKGKSSHKGLALACKAKWTVICFVTSPCCSLLTLYCFSWKRIQGLEIFLDGGFRSLYTASWITFVMLIYVITRPSLPCCSLFWMYSAHVMVTWSRSAGGLSINPAKWTGKKIVFRFYSSKKNALNRDSEKPSEVTDKKGGLLSVSSCEGRSNSGWLQTSYSPSYILKHEHKETKDGWYAQMQLFNYANCRTNVVFT